MNNSKKLICIIFVLIIATFIITYSVFGETIDELQTQKEDLKNVINETNNELTTVQNDIDNVSTQLVKINEEIAKYQEQLTSSNTKLAQAQMSVDALKTELEKAEKQYIYQKGILEQRMVAIYEAGDTVYLDVLLSSSSIKDFLSKFYYLSKMAAYDQKLVKEVSNMRQDIAAKKTLLEREVKKLTEEKEKNEKILITYENTKIVRNNYLSQLTETEKSYQERLEIYENDLNKLEGKILKVALENLGNGYVGGELAWPVPRL